jgi:hypothetical protein
MNFGENRSKNIKYCVLQKSSKLESNENGLLLSFIENCCFPY